MNLTDGEDLVLVEHSGDWFIKTGTFSPGTSFTANGNPIAPAQVLVVESDGAQSVNTAGQFISDNFGHQYDKIVGTRPKTAVRR